MQDMSRYLKPRKLMESAGFLASDSLCVYVNLVKPSLRSLFAFGKFGRMHNLMYDVDFVALYSGAYGIYPGCSFGGKPCVPFSTSGSVWGMSDSDFSVSETNRITFSPEENTVSFRNLEMFCADARLGTLPGFSAQVMGDTLLLKAEFSEDSADRFLHLPWYPLFDRYEAGSGEQYVEYYREGYAGWYGEDGFSVLPDSDTLILRDSYSRQASVRLRVKNGKIRLKSRTLPEMNNSLFLSTDIFTEDTWLEAEITLLPQRDVLQGDFYYPCGSQVTLTRNGSEKITFTASSERGEHIHYIGEGENTTAFHYCAVPQPEPLLDKAAQACQKLFWPRGPMAGIASYAYNPTTLVPIPRSGFVYCSHAGRIYPCIAAESMRSGTPDSALAGLQSLERLFDMSHRGEDGSIFTPLSLDENGSCGDRVYASRPSDSGIIIRALNALAEAFLSLNMPQEAEKCVRNAWANVMTVRKMQCPEGDFFERYHYPSARPLTENGNHKGTVNNWTLQLWQLLPLLERFGMTEEYRETKNIVTRFVDSQLAKTPSILQIAGGGEDCAEFGDALNTCATLLGIKWKLTGEEKYRKYAEDALLKAWALSFHYPDMPGIHCLYGNAMIGYYYDQPVGGAVAGGMHDLTSMEANLFAWRELGLDFGMECATNAFKSKLGMFLLDNGGMYMVIQRSPNYSWKDPNRSEALTYGGIGVFAMALARGEISI